MGTRVVGETVVDVDALIKAGKGGIETTVCVHDDKGEETPVGDVSLSGSYDETCVGECFGGEVVPLRPLRLRVVRLRILPSSVWEGTDCCEALKACARCCFLLGTCRHKKLQALLEVETHSEMHGFVMFRLFQVDSQQVVPGHALPSASDQTSTLSVGESKFPFSFQLPDALPSSVCLGSDVLNLRPLRHGLSDRPLEGMWRSNWAQASVLWRIHASMVGHVASSDLSTRAFFTAIDPIPSSCINPGFHPFHKEIRSGWPCFPFAGRSFVLSATMPRCVFEREIE
mmetsp:Transcript_50654/g.126103  ORF Transcript_50654/g.126103 Transcript_50654/m.126103 type:complete len:285 (-) Transcript_50654:118-972(-)